MSRIYQGRFDILKDILKRPLFLVSQKHIKISMSKLHINFPSKLYPKNTLKQRRFFVHQNYVVKITSK